MPAEWRVDPAAVAAWLPETCERSGVPLRVSDPVALRQIGVLLGAAAGERPRQAERAAMPRRRSLESPDWLHSLGIESLATTDGGGVDDDVIDKCADDRGLPGQVQTLPPVA